MERVKARGMEKGWGKSKGKGRGKGWDMSMGRRARGGCGSLAPWLARPWV